MKLLLGCILVTVLLTVGCRGSSPTDTPTATSIPTPTATSTPEATATPTTLPEVQSTLGATSPAVTVPAANVAPTPAGPQFMPLTISVTSETMGARPGEAFSVDVVLDPQGRGISGVQVWIEYQPDILEIVGVEPGPLLGAEPAVAGPITDEVAGLVQYAAARIGPTQPPTPSGVFATIVFRVLDTAMVGAKVSLKITEAKIPDENVEPIGDIAIGDRLLVEVSS